MELTFKKHHGDIFRILEKVKIKEDEELESYVHSLLDIEEAIEKIYGLYIKKILESENDFEVIQDAIWDIREEFRHIEYHINDGKLIE